MTWLDECELSCKELCLEMYEAGKEDYYDCLEGCLSWECPDEWAGYEEEWDYVGEE